VLNSENKWGGLPTAYPRGTYASTLDEVRTRGASTRYVRKHTRLAGRRTAQERVAGGRWRRIVLGDVLAKHVVELSMR
jgi:hypothetical protein